jgi:hypothetical protein
LILPTDWNKHQNELSLREKNALYNCAGYVIKTMREQKICQDCMLALGSKTKRITIRPYSKFVSLKSKGIQSRMSVLCDGQDISDCSFSRKSIFQFKKIFKEK